MAITKPSIYELIGNSMQGDLGGFTCYTSKRNKVVWFVKSPPLEPASLTQRTIRNLFVMYARTWKAMTDQQRDTWRDAADAVPLRIHGYDLFTWWMRLRDVGTLATIERQSGVTVHKPDATV